jgi:hypothetical protein
MDGSSFLERGEETKASFSEEGGPGGCREREEQDSTAVDGGSRAASDGLAEATHATCFRIAARKLERRDEPTESLHPGAAPPPQRHQ